MSEGEPAEDDALRIANFLCFSIYSTAHAFNRVYQPLLRDLGLTYPQYLVMVTLWERGSCTVGTVGQILQLESSTLTPLLKRLETLGHIERHRDQKDERQVLVMATDQGRALREEAVAIPQCVLDASGLSRDELADLQQRIDRLRSSLLSYKASGNGRAARVGDEGADKTE